MKLKFRLRIKLHDLGNGKSISFHYLTFSELMATTLIGEILSVDLFTGLLDMNGKEIFEGDIIRNHFDTDYGPGHEDIIVKYENGCFIFPCHDGEYNYDDFEKNSLEIIGNIYETTASNERRNYGI